MNSKLLLAQCKQVLLLYLTPTTFFWILFYCVNKTVQKKLLFFLIFFLNKMDAQLFKFAWILLAEELERNNTRWKSRMSPTFLRETKEHVFKSSQQSFYFIAHAYGKSSRAENTVVWKPSFRLISIWIYHYRAKKLSTCELLQN